MLTLIRRESAAAICGINKIDRLRRKDLLLPLIDEIQDKYAFEAIIPMSALHRTGLEMLSTEIACRMPEGPHLFDSEILTDRPLVFLVAGNYTRESNASVGGRTPSSYDGRC
ncbi:MAG: hypothetical protein CM1200mP9_07330 [Gammaproteobacteria bacterium]|nr:MAG: hypothetical protein CM1200mP9_07330 [Gammaproteobacteria bacterium]